MYVIRNLLWTYVDSSLHIFCLLKVDLQQILEKYVKTLKILLIGLYRYMETVSKRGSVWFMTKTTIDLKFIYVKLYKNSSFRSTATVIQKDGRISLYRHSKRNQNICFFLYLTPKDRGYLNFVIPLRHLDILIGDPMKFFNL